MRCQMPGCKNKSTKFTTKDGIFLGVHLENVVIFTCGNHLDSEIKLQLEKIGEEESSCLQHECNSFEMARKLIKKA